MGNKISPDGMIPSDIHFQVIMDLFIPRSGEYMMQFLGLANYLAQFVDHLDEIARPLYAVLKGTRFNKRMKPVKRLVIPD